MMPSKSAAVSGWNGFERPKPLASWYAEGLCDGLGDRLSMFDNSGTPSLELLRFRRLLATADGFEEALRARVDALNGFEHRSFSRIRAVEHLDGDLALVSTFTTGKRVAEIFWTPQARTGVHPTFAAWLIRDLTTAVADLHRQGEEIAHASLSPDKVILTPDGRLIIVEHVLGAALERLRLPIAKLWQALGLVAAEDAGGRARLDQRTDVIQVAWIALSLLLGRRVSPRDYPHRVDMLLDEFVATSRSRSPVLVPSLRAWLERALYDSRDSFASAIQAQAGLGDLRMHGGPHATMFAANRTSVEQLAFQPVHELQPLPEAEASSAPNAPPAHDASQPVFSEMVPMAVARKFAADDLEPADPYATQPAPPPRARRSRSAIAGWAAAAMFALLAVGEAAWIGRVEVARAAAVPAPPVPIVLDSLQSGDAVIVDGREVGVTPVTLTLTEGVRSIRVRARASVAPALDQPAPSAPAERPAVNTATALALAAARDKRGGLRIASPVELQVLEGEHVLGSSVDGPIVTTAGRHELDFVNSAVGYRSRQVVEIKAGQIVPMKITPPDGRVSVNAVPWAQVLINGNPVGETPLANLPVTAGEHEITFRHPQLGEQTQKVIVKSNALTRVSATFTR